MTDDLGDLIRLTLSDLAKETPTVYDQTTPALHRAQQRRLGTLVLSGVGLLTAIGVGTPLAMAATGDDQPLRPAPAATVSVPPTTPAATPSEEAGPVATDGVPSPSPTDVEVPVPSVSPTDWPAPVPSVVPTRPPRPSRTPQSVPTPAPSSPGPTDDGGPVATPPPAG